jgi:hypothetical protein
MAVAEMVAHNHAITASDSGHQHICPSHGHAWNDNNHSNLVPAHGHGLNWSNDSHVHNNLCSPSYTGNYVGGGNQNFVTGPDAWRAGYVAASASNISASVANAGQMWATGLNVVCGSIAASGDFWDEINYAAISASSASVGSTTPFNVLPAFQVLNYIIKT